ncbi:glycosyltransferase [Oryzobacter telluris]|uniref:glycosyltransferase n=1 Tax=Oryzobacter telluris TaxID=3149179 RepID=UPI00370D74F0
MTTLDSRPTPSVPPRLTGVAPPVTVIVPTRNEQGNVAELLDRLVPALPAGSEVLFVDDSDDGTPAAIEASACGHPVPVRTHHREPGERSGGLGGAVATGLSLATRDWCVVMDGDLQHPPELVPELVRVGQAGRSQLVVASRYDGGGDAESFGRARAFASTWATHLAKAFFPHRLAAITDPMSGFFAVRRDAVDPDALRPNGFKILLEIAVRGGPLRTSELSFHFGRRFAGESKASLREGVRLVVLLARLWFDVRGESRGARMAGFAAVGVSGLLVNTLALWVATGLAGLHYAVGATIATVVSTTWNWGVLEALVYPASKGPSTVRRFLAFAGLNGAALALRVPLIALLVERAGANYLLANLVSLVALFAARFVVTDTMIFRRPR